jgi:glycopeptide antibiotics resistance protein
VYLFYVKIRVIRIYFYLARIFDLILIPFNNNKELKKKYGKERSCSGGGLGGMVGDLLGR